MTDIVYLNGDFIEKSSAKISVLDRGFLFGDGIYEVIPVYQSKPFRLEQHIERLNYCAECTQIPLTITLNQWQDILQQLIRKNGGDNLSIYIQLTRGVAPERNHAFPQDTKPTVLIMCTPLNVSIAELSAIKVTLLNDIRWQHCNIKSISLLGGILLNQQANALGFQEAILQRENYITEATTSNVFIIKGNEIYTPPKNQSILGGITRDLIVELAQQHQIIVHQIDLTIEDLLCADEVWLSSSSREISPVVLIDDKIVANGEIGPITKQMHNIFQAFKQSLIN